MTSVRDKVAARGETKQRSASARSKKRRPLRVVAAPSARLREVVEAFAELHGMTRRETELLTWMAGGHSSRSAAAAQLGLSDHTVNNYTKSILRRLGVQNKTDVVSAVLAHLLSGNAERERNEPTKRYLTLADALHPPKRGLIPSGRSLTDEEWKTIEPTVISRVAFESAARRNSRLFVNAVLYRATTGVAWARLPRKFGAWQKVHNRFHHLLRQRVWDGVFASLRIEVAEVRPFD